MSKHDELSHLLKSLDIITVALLLTGQVTISGVFLQNDGAFGIPVSGPITGAIVSKAKTSQS